MWANTAAAISNLRELLADSDDDKYAYRKRAFNNPDGVNVTFKTFERRRVTDLVTAITPYGVFVNGSPVVCVTDDTATGEFTLSVAPVNGDLIEATYNYRWFLDSELEAFLKNAAQWLGYAENYLAIIDGLIPSALHYAGQQSYHRLAQWQSVRESAVYRVEDMPSGEAAQAVNGWIAIAKEFREKAQELRDDYYSRQGQALAPNFATLAGSIKDPMPRR